MEFHTFHLLHWNEGSTHQQVYKDAMEMIEYSEELGFDGVWIAEHHFREYGICPSIMPFAGFVAARTKKVKIGSAIVVLPFHNPLRAAEEAAQIDVLSNGRMLYGFGRGYQGIEFNGFNVALSEARDRTDEAVDIMRLAWTKDHFSYDGKFTQVDNVNVLPKPIQKPHPPLWTAAVSPETVGHYAKKGIPFIADPIATFGRCKRAVDEWRQVAGEHGFDTADVPFAMLRGLIIAETEKEAFEMAKRAHEQQAETPQDYRLQSAPIEKTGEFAAGYYYWKDRYLGRNQTVGPEFFWDRTWIAGDPERVRRIVKDMEGIGFKHMLFTLGRDKEDSKRRLKLFAEEVMPHFKARVPAA